MDSNKSTFETKYTFSFTDSSKKPIGKVSVTVNDFEDPNESLEIFKNMNEIHFENLEDFWNKYAEQSKLDEKEKILKLLGYAMAEFKNLQERNK